MLTAVLAIGVPWGKAKFPPAQVITVSRAFGGYFPPLLSLLQRLGRSDNFLGAVGQGSVARLSL